MPRVDVELIGPMRRPWPEQRRTLEVPEGTTAAGLLGLLGFSSSEGGHLTVRFNGARAARSAVLHEGDSAEVILVVGGG